MANAEGETPVPSPSLEQRLRERADRCGGEGCSICALYREAADALAAQREALLLAFEAGFHWCSNGTDRDGEYIGGPIEDGFAGWLKERAALSASPEGER